MSAAKGIPPTRKNDDEGKHQHLREAVDHMDEMTTPIRRLCGMLGVMTHLDTEWDSPNPHELLNTFDLLYELAEEIKERHEGFWHHYDKYHEWHVQAASKAEKKSMRQLKTVK